MTKVGEGTILHHKMINSELTQVNVPILCDLITLYDITSLSINNAGPDSLSHDG